MKKFVVMLVVLVLTFSLISCQSSEDADIIYDADGANYDFGGYVFQIIGGWHPSYGDSAIGDMVLKRYDDIEKEFNVTIEYQGVIYGINKTLFSHSITNEKTCDLMWYRVNELSEMINLNLIMPLNDSGYLDITDDKFGPESLRVASSHMTDNIYGVYPNNWPYMNISLNGHCLISFGVIKKYAQPDPYELLETGNWNWDNFEAICAACTDSNAGTYGVTTEHDEMLNSILFQNGCNFVTYNEKSGRWEYDFNTPAAIEAAEWVSSLVSQKLVYHNTSGDGKTSAQAIFHAGLSAFHIGPGYFGIGMNDLPNLTEGFGFIPCPFGDSNKDQKWNCKFDARQEYYGIPLSDCTDEDKSFPILNRLLDPLEETGYDWKSYYTKYVFYNSNSAESFIKMVEEASTAYFEILGRPQLGNFNSIMTGSSATQKLASMAESIQTSVDNAFNKD